MIIVNGMRGGVMRDDVSQNNRVILMIEEIIGCSPQVKIFIVPVSGLMITGFYAVISGVFSIDHRQSG